MKKMTDGHRIVAAIKTNRWHFTLFKRRRQSLVTSRWRQDHAHARTALSCTRTCKQPRFQSHRFFLLRGGTGDETNHWFRHQRQRLTWVAPKRILYARAWPIQHGLSLSYSFLDFQVLFQSSVCLCAPLQPKVEIWQNLFGEILERSSCSAIRWFQVRFSAGIKSVMRLIFRVGRVKVRESMGSNLILPFSAEETRMPRSPLLKKKTNKQRNGESCVKVVGLIRTGKCKPKSYAKWCSKKRWNVDD